MTESDYWYNRSSQDEILASRQHQVALEYWDTKIDFAIIESLNPKLSVDGNMWCCLYGENLQEGIAGFGETPQKAMRAFLEEFRKPLQAPLKIASK